MKNKSTSLRTNLLDSIKSIIQQAQQHIVRNINTTMLMTYFEIGKMIVEDELKGKNRADYAERVIRQLSIDLTKEFGKGYSKSNLEYMRQFYNTYRNRSSQIVQSMIGQSGFPFALSWTHYIQLLKIDNEEERSFYEIEASQNHWSVRELQRQYHSALYERLVLSRDKKGVKQLAQKGQIIEKPTDTLKSHYVLEFSQTSGHRANADVCQLS